MATTELPETSTPVTETDPLIDIALMYRIVVTAILVPVGTLGNCLVIVILQRKTFAKNTHSQFLKCLAVNDILILYSCLLPDTITRAQHSIHYNRSQFACKANWYIMIVLTNISSWLLVTLSIERVISVWLPFQAKQICTRKTAYISVISLALTLIVFNIVLVHFRYTYIDGNCDTGIGLWPWINSIAYSFGPASIMIACSTSIIIKLWILPTAGGKTRKISGNVLMMLALNISFLATTSPVVILFAATDIGEKIGQNDPVAVMEHAIVNMLFYSNSAINFILYTLSGPQFRREVMIMVGGKNRVGQMVSVSGSVADRTDTGTELSRKRDHSTAKTT